MKNRDGVYENGAASASTSGLLIRHMPQNRGGRRTAFRLAVGFLSILLWMISLSKSEGAMRLPPEAVVYKVATTGSDKNDGVSKPVRSIGRALAIIRGLRNAGRLKQRRVEVAVDAGTYVISEPITLSEADSGSPGFPLVIRASSPAPVSVVGGTMLTRWRTLADGVLEATLTDQASCPQQLFANGERRFRPRLPIRGVFEIAEVPGKGRLRDHFRAHSGDIPRTFKPDGDTEVVVQDAWIVSRMRLAEYDATNSTLRLQNSIPGRSKYGLKSEVPFYLDNVPVDTLLPGNWRCDPQKRTLRYSPLKDEVGKAIVASAPVLPRLLILQGSESKPVHDIEIRDLQFAYTSWQLPASGWRGHAKETGATGVVEMSHCRSIQLEQIGVRHSGGAGLVIGQGCSSVELADSSFEDLGGGGVAIGGALRRLPNGQTWQSLLAAKGTTHNIKITHNKFQGMGRVLAGSPGIWSGQAHHVAIVGNSIQDLFWSGIDVGWIHGGGPGMIESNTILDNRIDLYGQGVLSDMGGIHMVGSQPGTIVKGNYISRGRFYAYGAWGLYSDESNEGVSFIGNHISDTQSAAIHVHKPGAKLVFQDNVADNVGEAGIRCTKGDPKVEVIFQSNSIRTTPGSPPKIYCDGANYKFFYFRYLEPKN